MEHFRTILTPSAGPVFIGFPDPVLLCGSCFSDTLGPKLSQAKLITCHNPFGVVYHPVALHRQLRLALSQELPRENGYVKAPDFWVHHDFHSSFANPEKEGLKQQLVTTLTNVGEFLKKCRFVMLTYGTAWGYVSNQEIVANCHKLPASGYQKELSTVAEIVADFRALKAMAQEFNPDLTFILTLSPVRHLREGFEANAVSKAVLRQAIYELRNEAGYFPAYEILLDDLRDYRFYGRDYLHPNELAIDYIWDRFRTTYFNAETVSLQNKWQSIYHRLQHKPFHPESPAHQRFLHTLLSDLRNLDPIIDVTTEIKHVETQLSSYA